MPVIICTTSKTHSLHLLVTQTTETKLQIRETLNRIRGLVSKLVEILLKTFVFFSGFALHPLDGMLQGSPYVIALFIVPIHLITHLSLLFFELIWTASIHDCIHANIWPIMGAGYHTIHHTTYKHNYGHYTIWMDWMFGTLKVPLAEDDSEKAK